MKKILILGGSGLVGSTLIKYIPSDWKIFLTFNSNKIIISNTKSFKVDFLENTEEIIRIIKKTVPDYIVHTVAFSSVDFCEENHFIADNLHVNSTKLIANASNDINSKLIFLSTDSVFKGELNKKYTENDIPDPINYYALTKLQAEKIILDSSKRNVVLRTSVIYGAHPKSRFTNWIISSLKEKKTVDPFIDQYNSPTLVDDLAQVIFKISIQDVSGLFHATGPDCVNRYNFALMLAKQFNFDSQLIKPVTSLEKKQIAPRPSSTCLNSSKLEQKLNFKFRNLKTGIEFISS